MTSGRAGSISSELTAMFVRPSPVGRQVVPSSSLFQIPPDTPAAKIVVGTAGWNFTTRVRPPMLPGPSGVHASSTAVALLASLSDSTREPDSHTRDAG